MEILAKVCNSMAKITFIDAECHYHFLCYLKLLHSKALAKICPFAFRIITVMLTNYLLELLTE